MKTLFLEERYWKIRITILYIVTFVSEVPEKTNTYHLKPPSTEPPEGV